jgi:hypothetical protein
MIYDYNGESKIILNENNSRAIFLTRFTAYQNRHIPGNFIISILFFLVFEMNLNLIMLKHMHSFFVVLFCNNYLI